MLGDSIRQVRQAEEEADDLIEEASILADRIISDAKQESSLTVLMAQENARKRSVGIRESVLEEAEEEVAVIRKNAAWERRMIVLETGKRMEAAVKKALEIIEESAGRGSDGD